MSKATHSNAREIKKMTFSMNGAICVSLLSISILAFSSQTLAQAEAAIMAIEEKPTSATGRSASSIIEGQARGVTSRSGSSASHNSVGKSVPKTSAGASPKPQPVAKTQTSRKYDGFIVGDKYSFLNFEVVSKVQPIHTIKAKNAGASGLVQVEVLIDEDGNVLTAHARTGNALLHPEAEKAALATKFNKPNVYGKPARAMGFVVYRFGKSEDDDEN